mmetsp:Transcript_2797/g.4818  ORF Transcript_2797/g.4818 Transcript_2797/m.4818 type:complete len:610 (-) Transcript_2797:115-1944(-)
MTKNPLAAARSGKSSATRARKEPTARNELQQEAHQQFKTPSRAEQLWHKRSGGGFVLFVEYYCGQPPSVIVSGNTDRQKNDGGLPANITTKTDATTAETPTKGMSRAAQRRRKKRKRDNIEQEDNHEIISADGCRAKEEGSVSKVEGKAKNTIRRDEGRHRLLHNGQLIRVLESYMDNNQNASEMKVLGAEYEAFFTALSKPLPLTFRLRRGLNDTQVETLHQELGSLKFSSHVRPTNFDGNIFHAYRGLDKSSLPRVCPALKDFLNQHSQDGTIARQELGSMLPVWLLDKMGFFGQNRQDKRKQNSTLSSSPSSSLLSDSIIRVLDMCASPGSKSLQAAELIAELPCQGRVRANDINESRLKTLQEAIHRSGVKQVDQIVRYVNVDASAYPIPKKESKKYQIVLCDVPCSGDGTARKDRHIIPNWFPRIGNSLHSIQVRILIRALECVAVDGVVSYSTCSLNPVEDEAVVAAALNELYNKKSVLKFELLEVPQSLCNGLILRPGVTNWRIADYLVGTSDADEEMGGEEETSPRLQWYESYEEAITNNMNGACKSMWPCIDKQLHHQQQQQQQHHQQQPAFGSLTKCLRLLPQDQDTGGFFVALIQRTS